MNFILKQDGFFRYYNFYAEPNQLTFLHFHDACHLLASRSSKEWLLNNIQNSIPVF